MSLGERLPGTAGPLEAAPGKAGGGGTLGGAGGADLPPLPPMPGLLPIRSKVGCACASDGARASRAMAHKGRRVTIRIGQPYLSLD
jgi:hypothetical protein